jgi:hypothetical protein
MQRAFMRFNKTISVLLLGASLSLPLACQPLLARGSQTGEAAARSGAQSDNKFDKTFDNKSDKKNEGRKLSMTLPGIGTAVVTVTPAQVKPIALGKPLAPGRHLRLGALTSEKKDLSIETSGNNITVRVPASIDAAIDDAQVVSRQLGKCASRGITGASRVMDLMVLYFKQCSSTTTITPAGYPYAEKSSSAHAVDMHSLNMPAFSLPPTTIASGHKLYFTQEGRLKSVVTR